MDIFDKVQSFTQAKEAMELGVYPYFLPLQNSEGTTAIFEDGGTPEKDETV